MNIQDCIKFAQDNPVCCLASVEGDQPRVRNVLLWQADDTGFYFILLSPKKVSAQLKANPKAELCFYNYPTEIMQARQLRITGKMKLVKDPALQARAAKDRAFLSKIAGRSVENLLEIFKLENCDAQFWTMPDILKEAELPHAYI
ncbi:MAG: pyridoxamine 5'-phosphate oxidase family protein [Nibricoccus sp.]